MDRALPVLFILVVAGCPTTPPASNCETDADCDGEQRCVATGGARVCGSPCDLSDTCDEGYACQESEDGAVCVAILGTGQDGDACEGDLACASGACALEPEGAVCVADCTDGTSCPSGTRCLLSGFRLLCLSPLDDRPDGESCETPRDCLSSFCVDVPHKGGNMCASQCGDGCDDGLACVPLEVGAEVCVPAAPDGAVCTTSEICASARCVADVDGESICAAPCVDDVCDEGFACVTAVSSERVCMPILDARDDGEACTSARECASGHCGRFEAFGASFGDLCASPCDAGGGACADPLVCWSTEVGPDLCGPSP